MAVLVDLSMSLDGFIAGPNVRVESPMGDGGERLHEWLFQSTPNEIDARIAQEMRSTTGAVVLGRRTFEVGVGVWEDTPYPVPCFVLTHEPSERRVERSGTFDFVTDIDSACRLAKAAAGDRDVRLMGAAASQSFLRAGFVDEVRIQLVPMLLGDGRRLFADLGAERIELERADVIESPRVTHLRFRVVK